MNTLDALYKLCQKHVLAHYVLHSRMSLMKDGTVYVKRDDELGFGVSGSKLRKYASIFPCIFSQKNPVAVVGSLYSNHVLSLVQMLKQEKVEYQLFLEKPKSTSLEGNAFFLSLLLKKNEVIWVDEAPMDLEEKWKNFFEEKCGKKFFWIPPGGYMEESLLGSLTLALDIVKNEQDLGISLDHVFVDSGTGMSAIGLILGLSYLKKNRQVHVVLCAGKKEEFEEKLMFMHQVLEKKIGEPFPLISYRTLLPITAKSFGSHNQTIWTCIKEVAEKEGIFLDPIYNAKLLLTLQDRIKQENLGGKIAWIHSGGALSLSGFQKERFS